jgi:ABC-type amino acid transport substrate-binding protein
MTRLGLYCLGLLVLLAQPAGMAISAQADNGTKVRVVGAASPGILFEGPAGTPTGLAADIVASIFETLQQPYEIVILPAARARSEIERGTAHIMIWTNKRTADFGKVRVSSQSILVDHLVLVARTGDPIAWNGDINSLSGLTIGTVRGVEYGERVDIAKHNLALDEREDLETALRLLEADRVDVVMTDQRSFDAIAAQQQGFTILPPDVDRVAGYFRFADGDAVLPLIERFNGALDNLVLDGIIADLNRKYGLRF